MARHLDIENGGKNRYPLQNLPPFIRPEFKEVKCANIFCDGTTKVQVEGRLVLNGDVTPIPKGDGSLVLRTDGSFIPEDDCGPIPKDDANLAPKDNSDPVPKEDDGPVSDDDDSPAIFLLCELCKKVIYCSPECEDEHQPYHVLFCQHVTSNGSSSRYWHPVNYYTLIASQDPAVADLAKTIGLEIPDTDAPPTAVDLRKPVGLLVIHGLDTPKNMILLFGEQNIINRNQIAKIQSNLRKEVLLLPPRTSRLYAAIQAIVEGPDLSSWCPRPADAGEYQTVRDVWAMQDTLRRHLRSCPQNVMAANEMGRILKAIGDAGWGYNKTIATYTLAIRAMNHADEPRLAR